MALYVCVLLSPKIFRAGVRNILNCVGLKVQGFFGVHIGKESVAVPGHTNGPTVLPRIFLVVLITTVLNRKPQTRNGGNQIAKISDFLGIPHFANVKTINF